MPTHRYYTHLTWTGNIGSGTSAYTTYSRDHAISAEGHPPLLASSDPTFRGDPARYNPEQLLVAALSSCHMLWFLHLAANAKIIVTAYSDDAQGTMEEAKDGGGHFSEAVLHPAVTVVGDVLEEELARLHHRAHELCFIANSVSFPVICEPAAVHRT
jgi:organic hydroperoxide reductase OsmC/OhrA